MKARNAKIFQATGLFVILGFILYASFTGLKPSDVEKSVDDAKAKYNEFSENYDEAKKKYYKEYYSETEVEPYSGAEKMYKDDEEKETKNTSDIASDSNDSNTDKRIVIDNFVEDNKINYSAYQDDNATAKKAEEEQTFIDGKKFEVVIGESCDRIHENAHKMVKMLDEACGDYKKMNMNKFKEYAEVVKGEYEFVMSAPFPTEHESTKNALNVYGNKIDVAINDFIDNAKKADSDDYIKLSDKLQTLYNSTNNIFGGYRLNY